MAKMRFNKNLNINRVVRKVVYTVLALYVGGTVMNVFGAVMENTTSGFYSGLSLIGWTVSSNTITDSTDKTGGVLAVIGIIAIAAVVLEFISFR